MGAQGVSALPLLVVEHPLGGERPEAIARRAQQAFEQLHALIAGSPTALCGERAAIDTQDAEPQTLGRRHELRPERVVNAPLDDHP